MSRELDVKVLVVEDAKIGYRNFKGAEGAYNRSGDRNFVVFFDEETAKELALEGWNVKWPKPNPNIDPAEDRRTPYLPVTVAFDNIPPKVVLIVNDKATLLTEDQVETLDYAEMEKVDLTLSPYNWEVNGKTGIKAYLRSLYVTLKSDIFTDKYGI